MKKGEIPVTPLHAAPAEVSLSLCTHVRGSDTACAGTRHQRSDSEAPEQKRTWQSTRDSNSAGSTRDRYLHGATLIRVGKKKITAQIRPGPKSRRRHFPIWARRLAAPPPPHPPPQPRSGRRRGTERPPPAGTRGSQPHAAERPHPARLRCGHARRRERPLAERPPAAAARGSAP